MSLYTLKSTVILPSIKSPQRLRIEECTNTSLLAWMGSTTEEDVVKRLANDHLAFVAYMNNIPAAFGWMARGKATIGELGHELVLPIGNRYLWNFRTMEAFRGLGIYPALLHYII
ncbi:MAG: N-acetyltransferase, partial [Chitinophagaceae bacterium]